MRILITGGAGFIGSALAENLIIDGHDVIIVDNYYTGKKENIKSLNCKKIIMDLSDITNLSAIDHMLNDIDIVYHFAASIGVTLIKNNPYSTFLNSLNINNLLFPLFKKHDLKVIYASTSEVYGDTKKIYGSNETDHLEIFSGTRGSYASSKLFYEFYLKSLIDKFVIARFFNIVGPGQVSTFGHVIPKFIEACINEKDITVYNYGEQVRSFCDIRDAIEILKLFLNDEHNGRTYNVGNQNNTISIGNLAKLIKKELNSSSNIVFEKNTYDDIFERFPNTSKISKYYTCKYSLQDIIRNIYEKNFSSNSAS